MRTPTVTTALLFAASVAGCPAPAVQPGPASKPAAPTHSAPVASAVVSTEPEAPVIGPPKVVPQFMGGYTFFLGWAPNGALVALSNDGLVHLVELKSGHSRGVLPGRERVGSFSSNGKSVILVGETAVRVWDLTLDTVRTIPLPEPMEWPTATFVKDRVYIPHFDGVTIVDVNGATTKVVPVGATGDLVGSVQAAQTGHFAAISKRTLFVVNEAGKVIHKVDRPTGPEGFLLSPQGEYLAHIDGTSVVVTALANQKEVGRFSACEGEDASLAFTGDEQRLVVGCEAGAKGQGRVFALQFSNGARTPIVKADSTAFVQTSGNKVAVINKKKQEVTIYDVATGKTLDRFENKAVQRDLPIVSASLDRVIFGAERPTDFSVVGSNNFQSGRLYGTSHGFGTSSSDRGVHSLLGDSNSTAMAVVPQTLQILPIPSTEDVRARLSPNGDRWLLEPVDKDWFELREISTGKKQTVEGARTRTSGCVFSPHGRWVQCLDVYTKPENSRLFDVTTGKRVANYPAAPWNYFTDPKWNSDDSLILHHASSGKDKSGKACKDCWTVEVYNAVTGKKVTDVSRSDVKGLSRFTADGQHIYWDGTMFDARSGKTVWSLPKGAKLGAAEPPDAPIGSWVDTWVVKAGLLVTLGEKSLILDYATGKTVQELDRLDEVTALSLNGAFFIGLVRGVPYLYNTSTWERIPLKTRQSLGRISDDGKVLYEHGSHLTIHRLSDGQALRRRWPNADLDLTDEGVFDGDVSKPGAVLVRRGPHVLLSPMEPASAFEKEFYHPGLFADFMAGKDVSPKR
ncbi:MAG: hypothetical protein IPK82_35730 [Polyangiaceae bacterium]|nr:hypothetical protein [Polyangiaceae bacterium]